MNDDAFDLIAFLQTEGERQFRLRQVAGTAFDHARLLEPSRGNLDGGADGVAIGFGSDQVEADAVMRSQLVVAIQVSWAVVGRDQQNKIAIAIEVSVGQTSSDFR